VQAQLPAMLRVTQASGCQVLHGGHSTIRASKRRRLTNKCVMCRGLARM
jgi:hypothetical protein